MKIPARNTGRREEWLVASIFVLLAVIAVRHLFELFDPEWYAVVWRSQFYRRGVTRLWGRSLTPEWFELTSHSRPLGKWGVAWELELVHAIPLLVLASLAVLVASWMQAVQARRRLGRSLGFALCLAGVFGALEGGGVVGLAHVQRDSPLPGATLDAIEAAVPSAGWMVFGAWVVFALRGRGCPKPTSLDWLGTALGGVWVILLACSGW